MSFTWIEEYSVGVKRFDDQHKELINIIDKLAESINRQVFHGSLDKILEEVVDYAKYHFRTEEEYFEKYHYPEKEEHIKEHRSFSKKIGKMQEQFKKDEMKYTFELIDYLEDWLVSHLNGTDKKYTRFFHEKGVC